jgi:nucleotidyltransferase substrate binding protein (TIGR01987 family)
VVSDRDRAGVIQAFEFTFEAVWKLLKHLAEGEGLTAESPKRALISAFKMGVVKDETLWLEMLRDRNLTSHTYHLGVADRIFSAIRDHYVAALEQTVQLARTALIA